MNQQRNILPKRIRVTRHARRGVTIVVVLGLIAMTIALSYAMIRTQAMSVQIQQNLDRRSSARQAAITGLTIAIRKMHDADWEGIDSVVASRLGDNDGFSASYATGDASLSEDDPDYDEYPFRVTITSIGAWPLKVSRAVTISPLNPGCGVKNTRISASRPATNGMLE